MLTKKVCARIKNKTSHTYANKKKRPESALVVVHTMTKALLIKRADHENFWQSVTGTLENDELAYDAAVRELFEETGIVADDLRATGITRTYTILPEWQHRYPVDVTRNKESLFYCFLENEVDIVLDQNEHTDYQWLPFDEASDLAWSWSNKIALMSLRNY